MWCYLLKMPRRWVKNGKSIAPLSIADCCRDHQRSPGITRLTQPSRLFARRRGNYGCVLGACVEHFERRPRVDFYSCETHQNVPGRETDVHDALRGVQLLRPGLIIER